MQRIDRTKKAPLGMGLIFLSLAAASISLKVAGLENYISPRLGAVLEAWGHIASAMGGDYRAVNAAEWLALHDFTPGPTLAEPTCEQEETALLAKIFGWEETQEACAMTAAPAMDARVKQVKAVNPVRAARVRVAAVDKKFQCLVELDLHTKRQTELRMVAARKEWLRERLRKLIEIHTIDARQFMEAPRAAKAIRALDSAPKADCNRKAPAPAVEAEEELQVGPQEILSTPMGLKSDGFCDI